MIDKTNYAAMEPMLWPIANIKPEILRCNQIESSHRLFRSGAKLYCLLPYSGGDSYEHLRVLALPKNGHRFISITIKARDAHNYRIKTIYSPKMIEILKHYWRNNLDLQELEYYIARWKRWSDMPYTCAVGSSEIADRPSGFFVLH